MFKKVLIANRGEIALRIIRACRELGIKTVAVHSDVDNNALHVRFADEAVCIGPAKVSKSYLNIASIFAAAEITGAEAIHPGYGFLAENSDFAALCEKCGLVFIGPTAENMRQWGNKVAARDLAKRLGLPVLSGTAVLIDAEEAVKGAESLGFPVMLKAVAGGGGRGIKLVRSAEEMRRVFNPTRTEALASFGNGEMYCERYIEEPRHIEFQVLGDDDNNAYVFGERECSIQANNQKLVEESPSVAVSRELREDMSQTVARAMRESGYRSLGTLEFLMDEKGSLYFMEMNTRVQVEHPVTEMVIGIDLIAEQIRIASGEQAFFKTLPVFQNGGLEQRGHAIECRINAADPNTLIPWPGLITEYHPPGGAGIRVDGGIYGGWRVPKEYDSLLVKVIAHGRNRSEAIARIRRALDETIITGIRTNIDLHRRILTHSDFVAGKLSTHFLERLLGSTRVRHT
jgi:acetyl-CoA carboxylase, biotin carboxylase subunit